METSPTIGKLSIALAKAQGEIRGAAKDSANPFFKTKYADLASVRDAIQDALSKHGIAYVQFPEGGPETVTITTVLACADEWMRASFQLRPIKADPQGMGSAITYGRRYALMAAVGVAPEDDDGNAASGNKPVSRGNPLKAEADKLADEIEACIDKEQLDTFMATREVKAFLARADSAGGGLNYADVLMQRYHQHADTFPKPRRDNGGNPAAEAPPSTPVHIPAAGPTHSALYAKIAEKFDIVDSPDQFKEAQDFATKNAANLTPAEKVALNALSKKVGARLRETA